MAFPDGIGDVAGGRSMGSKPTDERPIVRISRLCMTSSVTGRGKRQRAETERWTVYGVDADGVERVYVEHVTGEEHKAWKETDPLWREAQRALLARLLRNPATRDTVLQINIRAALDAGDRETAAVLASHLSTEVRHRLIAMVDQQDGTDHDARDG